MTIYGSRFTVSRSDRLCLNQKSYVDVTACAGSLPARRGVLSAMWKCDREKCRITERSRPQSRMVRVESHSIPGLQTQKLDSSKLRVRPQKEEPRQAPTVVLDEAAYDTSIRFVLVAAVLFVLFLVLLLLSKTIK